MLLEKNTKIGGEAYSTTNNNHLLNVVASKMSAFVSDPVNELKYI